MCYCKHNAHNRLVGTRMRAKYYLQDFSCCAQSAQHMKTSRMGLNKFIIL